MTRKDLFKRACALVGVAVASKLPMPEPGPVSLKGISTPLKPAGGTWYRLGETPAGTVNWWHDSGLAIEDYGDGTVRRIGGDVVEAGK